MLVVANPDQDQHLRKIGFHELSLMVVHKDLSLTSRLHCRLYIRISYSELKYMKREIHEIHE